MKHIKFSTVLAVLFFIFLFFLFLENSIKTMDPDLGWHLKVGEEIAKTKSLPTTEHFDYPLEGESWVDFEWLANLISYEIYANLSYFSLNIFFVLIILAVAIILYVRQKNNFSAIALLFFILLGSIASLPSFGVRMQEISVLCLLLELIILEKYSKNGNIKPLFLLIPLFYFWACSHGGFLVGLVVLFAYIFTKYFEILLLKFRFSINLGKYIEFNAELKKINKFLIVSALTVLSTFLTPYGFKLYGYLHDFSNTYYLKHIQEWLPFFTIPISNRALSYFAISLSLLIVAVWQSFKKRSVASISEIKNKVDLFEIFLFFQFFAMAMMSRRHFPLFFIASFPLNIKNFQIIFSLPSDNFFRIKTKHYDIIKIYAISAMILLAITQILKINPIKDPFNSFCSDYPCQAVEFLKTKNEFKDLRLFNEYRWGGYLIWVWPERKLFIDGRLPQYPMDGRSFLEEYLDFYKKDSIDEMIGKHRISMALLGKRKKRLNLGIIDRFLFNIKEDHLDEKEDELLKYLSNNNEWKNVYSDDISAVFVKKNE